MGFEVRTSRLPLAPYRAPSLRAALSSSRQAAAVEAALIRLSELLNMNPADLDTLAKDDKDELMAIIETMQTRDRRAPCRAGFFRAPLLSQTSAAELGVLTLLRDSLRMYNGLVERCFTTCVDSFRRKTLEKTEEQARPALAACAAASRADSRAQCVTKCCEKFLKHSARVSVRFAELNAGQEQPK